MGVVFSCFTLWTAHTYAYASYLISLLFFPLLFSLSYLTSWLLIVFFPKAEERIQGEVSVVFAALSPSLSCHDLFLLSISLIPVVFESWLFISWSPPSHLQHHETFSANIMFWLYLMQSCLFFSLQQIRMLRRELESSQEKVSSLTTQLTANVRITCLIFRGFV